MQPSWPATFSSLPAPDDQTERKTPYPLEITPSQAGILLDVALRNPAAIVAYACAVRRPGADPVDEILYVQTGGQNLAVLALRYPGSFTGGSQYLLAGRGPHTAELLLSWAGLVFSLADNVENRGKRGTATCAPGGPHQPGPAEYAHVQANDLRWRTSYALTAAFRDATRDAIADQYGTAPPAHDLGELTAFRLAELATDEEAACRELTPSGWDRLGWDEQHPRTFTLLAPLRTPRDAETQEGED
ncbi:hypothetical protein [Actinomadura coerulea]|uniref:hypothetical protein n=1 Tax=Actinomadura coerulea TaxID=46159 RepID=UPI0034156501